MSTHEFKPIKSGVDVAINNRLSFFYYFPILCNFTNEDFAQGIYNNQY